MIKPESVISDIAVLSSWNLDETANICKNTWGSNSTDNTYTSVKSLFKQAIELMSDIVKDISAKEFNTSVNVCWSKRANIFRFTTVNQKLQKKLLNKTQIQISPLKSKKTVKKKVSKDIWSYKIKGFNKDFNSQPSISSENKNLKVIDHSVSDKIWNEMPNSFQKVDILSSNITSIIPSHDLARILEMLSQSIKIIKSWNNTWKFVKKNIDEWIQR